jgi:cytochrome c-type biogenesis protein CcmE
MGGRKTKFLFLGLGIAAAMIFLLAVGLSREGGFVYYYTVSEFKAMDAQDSRNFRLNGKVAEGSIRRMPTGLDVAFTMRDDHASLPVVYHGVIPDTFVDGADVVVEGALQEDGVFKAHNLLAKCPSKYEAALQAGEADPHMEQGLPYASADEP